MPSKKLNNNPHNLRILIPANNGDIGGGEVMQVALAQELVALGHSAQIIGPTADNGVVHRARSLGLDTVEIAASGRKQYMFRLRRWLAKQPYDLLWCNGSVPAVATMGMPRRVVHLHLLNTGLTRLIVGWARVGAIRTVVPSAFMNSRLSGSTTLQNWVGEIRTAKRDEEMPRPYTIGFLGRPSVAKGTHLLARAVEILEQRHPGEFHLTIAGEPHFVDHESRTAVEDALTAVSSQSSMIGWTEPGDLFGQIDVLACPSIADESFGLVAAEAMSAHMPLIISDAGALPEVAGHGHPWIVRGGDAQCIADVIEQSRSAEGRNQTIHDARKRWETHWSPDAGRIRLEKLLLEIGRDLDVKRR